MQAGQKIAIRKSHERGHANHGWLDTYHTFSFADYRDPHWMRFRSLRVINEDRVEPGQGFGTHPHRDMEIITVVLAGALEHKDSLGTGSIIRPGDVQRMSAGTGIEHSEFNPSETEPVHLLQIWILPERTGLQPGYEQRAFSPQARRGKLCLLASREGRDGSVTVHQDVSLYSTILDAGQRITHSLQAGRGVWMQIVHGKANLNGIELLTGDGASVSDEITLELRASDETELLLFDLA